MKVRKLISIRVAGNYDGNEAPGVDIDLRESSKLPRIVKEDVFKGSKHGREAGWARTYKWNCGFNPLKRFKGEGYFHIKKLRGQRHKHYI